MLNFDLLRWKNFLSTGNVWSEIALNEVSNALIIGDNGAGKSTLLDAICFVLFGKPFRKIKKGQIVNSINAKDCLVEIEFRQGTHKYLVRRGIKPDIFEIWADGIRLKQNAKVEDQQNYLERFVLGMNQKTFMQIVIAGAANYVPFMQSKADDRRAFVEDLLDIRVFRTMSDLVKARDKATKDAIEKNKLLTNAKNEQRAMIERNIEKLKINTEDEIDLLHKRISSLKAEMIQYDEFIWNMEKAMSESTLIVVDDKKLRTKIQKMRDLRTKMEAQAAQLTHTYKFFDTNCNCPTCTQPIEEEFKWDELLKLETKINELEKGIKDIDSQIEDHNKTIEKNDAVNKVISNMNTKIASAKADKGYVERGIASAEAEIKRLQSSNTLLGDAQDDLKKVVDDIIQLEEAHMLLLEDRALITTAQDLLKDGGIKTKIIKQYLPIINKTINKYLSAMGFLVHFELNETFDETIKSRYRDDFSYENFSEGEKMRIDLALLFTWRAIAKMKNSVNTNLLIMDEVFDGSLDNAGIDDFLKIMWGFTTDVNTFIISHKQDQMIDKFKKVYKATKRKNFSYLEAMQ